MASMVESSLLGSFGLADEVKFSTLYFDDERQVNTIETWEYRGRYLYDMVRKYALLTEAAIDRPFEHLLYGSMAYEMFNAVKFMTSNAEYNINGIDQLN